MQMGNRPEKIVCTVFFLIGLGLMVGAWFMYDHQKNFLSAASFTQGRVTDLARNSDSDGDTFAPVVAFTTPQGTEVEFTSSVSSNPPSFAVGEIVEVAYHADNPLNAQINTFWSLWLGVIILGGMGVFFAGFSTLFLTMVPQGDPVSIDEKIAEMKAKMEAAQSESKPHESSVKRNDDWPDGGSPNSTVQRG